VLALGAFMAMRPRLSGYGVGFSVFFRLLAGPDNIEMYRPDLLINNGIAIVMALLGASIAFAVIFPSKMPWLIKKITGNLRGQVVLACGGDLRHLNQRFQSDAHDLMAQLRALQASRARQRDDALQWMLATLEVGHAVIDLRKEMARAAYRRASHPRLDSCLQEVIGAIGRLFDHPDQKHFEWALASIAQANRAAQELLLPISQDRESQHALPRVLSCLHFIRTALLDKDAPFSSDL
jgi:uncharacterized membrane protein YccC